MKKIENIIRHCEGAKRLWQSQSTSTIFKEILTSRLSPLLRMTFTTLTIVALLSTTLASESWAASNGTCNDDGSCLWSLDDNGKFTISTKDNATGVAMKNYGWSGKPWDRYMTSITSVEIKNGITNIGYLAFADASRLTSITIPDSVTYIADWAFVNTSRLTSITIPDSVTGIGYRAFYGASGLTSITIPDSVTTIGNSGDAFALASSLTEIVIPDSWADMGISNYAMFYGTCFSQTNRPAKCPDDMSNVKIVCQGDTTKCEKALARFRAGGGACTVGSDYCLDSAVQVVSATSASQCTGVGYIWDTTGDGACRRKTANECNEYDNYYYTGGRCQILPKKQSACTTADFFWDSTGSQCVKVPTKSMCTAKGQVLWDNKCMDEYPFAKKHWTPAEVNEWLKDDDNTITITFKHK